LSDIDLIELGHEPESGNIHRNPRGADSLIGGAVDGLDEDAAFGLALSQALRARPRSHRPSGTFRNSLWLGVQELQNPGKHISRATKNKNSSLIFKDAHSSS
jgi:hypothetical protein